VYRTLSVLVDAGLIQRGVSHDDGMVFSHTFETKTTRGDLAASILPASRYADLCAASHRSLIAGRCPWCGRTIIDGQPLRRGKQAMLKHITYSRCLLIAALAAALAIPLGSKTVQIRPGHCTDRRSRCRIRCRVLGRLHLVSVQGSRTHLLGR
jgi:hypothetical protein